MVHAGYLRLSAVHSEDPADMRELVQHVEACGTQKGLIYFHDAREFKIWLNELVIVM